MPIGIRGTRWGCRKCVPQGADRSDSVDGVVDVGVVAAFPVPVLAGFGCDTAIGAKLESRGVGMDPSIGPSCTN